MRVYIPSPLRSYTQQREEVDAEGLTLSEIMAALDQQYPGIRFRIINEQDQIREHIKIFINSDQATSLASELEPGDEISILCALSGGQL
jgi:molybdopterin converting factor small subunit